MSARSNPPRGRRVNPVVPHSGVDSTLVATQQGQSIEQVLERLFELGG